MSKCKSMETAIVGINEECDDGEPISFDVAREKADSLNPFVIMYYDSMLDIIKEYDLHQTEIKALLRLLHYMKYGNLVSISFSQIMRDIDVKETNSTRVMKKLFDSGIIIKKDGCTYLNPQILRKGKLIGRNKFGVDIIELGAEEMRKRNYGLNVGSRKARKGPRPKSDMAEA